MHGHQLQRIGASLRLIVAGFERGVGKKSGKAGVVLRFVRDKARRGVDQFTQVFETVRAFALLLVMLFETTVLDHVFDNFGQRQPRARRAHAGDQRDECVDAFFHRARFVARAFFQHPFLGRRPQADAARARQFLQLLERAVADAAGGEIDDAQQRAVVFVARQHAQIGERVLDFLALEKAQAAVDAIRHAGIEQRVFKHARLRIRAVKQRNLGQVEAFVVQRFYFFDDEARLVDIAARFVDSQRLALAFGRPQILAEAPAVVIDQRIGGVQNVAVRAVVLLELDHLLDRKILLQVLHVGGRRAPERVNRLVVVADREYRVVPTRQHAQPVVLQLVGVLEFVDQDVAETAAVVVAQGFVLREQFVAAQQQLGKIDDAFALTLLVVNRIEFLQAAREAVVIVGINRALAGVLVAVDVPRDLARREFLLIDVGGLHHALDERQLVLAVEDLEELRQPRLAVMRAQHPVARAVKGAHPHAARVDRQHRADARKHFLRRFVGERDREQSRGARLPGLDQPGDARRQHAGFAAAGAGEYQRRLVRQRDGFELRLVETG